ncbi:MAG: hypothetical protein IIV41_00805, partial [Akkermansia sp.]|nr:hypothetical protein [Akkermansia sp.]
MISLYTADYVVTQNDARDIIRDAAVDATGVAAAAGYTFPDGSAAGTGTADSRGAVSVLLEA